MNKQTTLITGSTSGIGLRCGLDLLEKNHFVIFTGRTYQSCETLKQELDERTIPECCYLIVQVDFSNQEQIEKFCQFMLYDIEKIDNIVFNVGTTCRKSFEDTTLEDWDNVFNTNLVYPFFMCQALQPIIKRRIIFIGSVLGHVPDSSSILYGITKGSLEIMTPYLAKVFAPFVVTVNTVALGFVQTAWHRCKSDEQIERIKEKTLLKRFGTTKEVSSAVQFLIENDYVTGQIINVDGGYKL